MKVLKSLRLHLDAFAFSYFVFLIYTVIIFLIAVFWEPIANAKTYAFLSLVLTATLFSIAIGLAEYQSLFKTFCNIQIDRLTFYYASVFMGFINALFHTLLFLSYSIGFHYLSSTNSTFAFEDVGITTYLLYLFALLALYSVACTTRIWISSIKYLYRLLLVIGFVAIAWYGRAALQFVQEHITTLFSSSNQFFVPYLILLLGITLLMFLLLLIKVRKIDI